MALQDGDGVLTPAAPPRLDGDGQLGEPQTVDTSGISLDGLLGFSGDDTVAVRAYLLESGNIERVLDIQLDGGSPVDVTTLPPPGENWRGSATLAVSGDALRSGSTDFDNGVWPWSYRAAADGVRAGRAVRPRPVADPPASALATASLTCVRRCGRGRSRLRQQRTGAQIRGEAAAASALPDCQRRPDRPERKWNPSMNTRTIAIAALVIAVIILLIFLF